MDSGDFLTIMCCNRPDTLNGRHGLNHDVEAVLVT